MQGKGTMLGQRTVLFGAFSGGFGCTAGFQHHYLAAFFSPEHPASSETHSKQGKRWTRSLGSSVWQPFQSMELSSICSQRSHHGREGPKDSSVREEVFGFLFMLLDEMYVSSSYGHPLLLTDCVV